VARETSVEAQRKKAGKVISSGKEGQNKKKGERKGGGTHGKK